MGTTRLVDIFRRMEGVTPPDRDVIPHLVAEYISSDEKHISAREILDFRICRDSFSSFMTYFRDLFSFGNLSSHDNESVTSDREVCLRLLLLLSADYDFSYQLGQSGGHTILKYTQRHEDMLSAVACTLADEVISSILECGVQYPLKMSLSHDESVVTPLFFDLNVQRNILFTSSNDHEKGALINIDKLNICIRQVPAGLHGAGQAAVGYVMWSSAVILSRWLALNSDILRGARVLEIGAGNALCSITSACFADNVTISDFNEIVLKNIENIVDLNSSGYELLHSSTCDSLLTPSCLNNKNVKIEICRLDWNKLLPTTCVPSDASSTFSQSDGVVKSKYDELADSEHTRHFDLIIASDVVCCESDAVGVAHTLLKFLSEDDLSDNSTIPAAIVVVPSAFHRYGVKSLITTLVDVGLTVHWRYIWSSSFCNDAHDQDRACDDKSRESTYHAGNQFNVAGCSDCDRSLRESRKFCTNCDKLVFNGVNLLNVFQCDEKDDYLTGDLDEAKYYKWMFLIIHGGAR